MLPGVDAAWTTMVIVFLKTKHCRPEVIAFGVHVNAGNFAQVESKEKWRESERDVEMTSK